MNNERTRNASRNIVWGLLNNFIKIFLPFAVRTVIIHLLGKNYLGLNGLFSSIINVLNLADLGFGTAVVYCMYKPIAEEDTEKIRSLLFLFRKIYRIVGMIVLICGVAIVPFLKLLIAGETPDDINIKIVFLIYLFNTVLSYWAFAYKQSLLSAYQRNDVISRFTIALSLVQNGIQIALLFLFRDYYIYLIVLPFITLAKNLCISMTVNKMFPDIIKKGPTQKVDFSGLKNRIGGLFLSKVCGTTRNSLDSIFISSFLGLTSVAMYSNYYYILTSVHSIIIAIGSGILAGVGNSIAKENVKKNYLDFRKINFIYMWIVSWCACCLICLYQHFMYLWMGNSLSFSNGIMILFCIYFYLLAMTDIKNVYTDACGLWWENRYRSILETIVNLVLNWTLGYYFGVLGILLATIITIVVINTIYGTIILFKHYFTNESVMRLFSKQLYYFIVASIVSGVTYMICGLFSNTNIFSLIIKLFICALIPNILLYIFYHNSDEFKLSYPIVKKVFSFVRKKTE